MVHKIDGIGATAQNEWTEGDPVLGVPFTVATADWLNMVQGELVNVIEAAGLTPSKGNDAQLLSALELLGATTETNKLWNPLFDVRQRYPIGTLTSLTTPTMVADRWVMHPGTGGAAHVFFADFVGDLGNHWGQSFLPHGEFPRWLYKHNQNTVATAASVPPSLSQKIIDVRNLAGNSCVLSFFADAGLSTTVTVTPVFIQHFGDHASASADVTITGTPIVVESANPRMYTQLVDIPSIVGKTINTVTDPDSWLEVRLEFPDSLLFAISFWNVRLEAGVLPRPNLWLSPQAELYRCMTLFEKTHDADKSPYQNPVSGGGQIQVQMDVQASGAMTGLCTRFLVPKRWRNFTPVWYSGDGDPATTVNKVNVGGVPHATGITAEWNVNQTGVPFAVTAPAGEAEVRAHWVVDAELPLV